MLSMGSLLELSPSEVTDQARGKRRNLFIFPAFWLDVLCDLPEQEETILHVLAQLNMGSLSKMEEASPS